MTWSIEVSAACALYGVFAGQLVPGLIARVPEPEPEPESEPESEPGPEPRTGPVAEPGATGAVVKEPYVSIARRRGLGAAASVVCGVVGGLVGGVTGWSPALSFLLFLVVVGTALAVIDWRTRLLPTKLIAPSYAVVLVLVLVSAWVEQDVDALVRAGWGWLVAGGGFFVLWFIYPRGMGYGDVRLAGVLGLALGYLGWGELLVGLYTGFVAGGVGGLLLSMLRLVDRRSYPFGPFMLAGAVVGVVLGPQVAAWYA